MSRTGSLALDLLGRLVSNGRPGPGGGAAPPREVGGGSTGSSRKFSSYVPHGCEHTAPGNHPGSSEPVLPSPPAFVEERDSQVWEGPRGMLGWPGSSTFHSLPCSTGLAVCLVVSPVPGHRGREEGSPPLSVLPWEGSGSWVKSLLVLAPSAGVSRGCVPEPGV